MSSSAVVEEIREQTFSSEVSLVFFFFFEVGGKGLEDEYLVRVQWVWSVDREYFDRGRCVQ